MNIVLSTIWLLLAVVIGGLIVSFLAKVTAIKQSRVIKLLLAFSGGFLLAIAFHHFLPELYLHEVPNVGLFVIIGFIVQLLLEFFSEGIEHGHVHAHKGHHLPYVMLLSLSIHSFIEGIPLAISDNGLHVHEHAHHHFSTESYLIGIILHQIPVAIALMTLLKVSEFSNLKSWTILMIFGAMTPLGMLFGHFYGNHFEGNTMQYILAIVIGMFLHISTTIIFEASENHKFNFFKLISIISGIVLAIMINF